MIWLVNDNNSIPLGTVDEAAAYWMMRLSSAGCGPADRSAFEAWRHQKFAHAEAYARAEHALAVVDRHVGSTALSPLGEKVLVETERNSLHVVRAAMASVAVALTLVVSAAIYLGVADDEADQTLTADMETYETAIGGRSMASSSDGSSVTLNTDSRVEVDFSPDVRRLTLLRGQALFEVTKDSRPFEVIAGDRRIVALGTAFDVRVDPDVGVQVTLLKGRVSVDSIVQATTVSNALWEPQRNELVPGEQLIARAHEPAVVAPVDTERVTSWREGRLVFRDEPLAQAVKEINRYNASRLFVSDDVRLRQIRVSGVFQAGRTDSFVLALETIHPVAAQQLAEDHIALLWRE